jgi:dTDP-L-rhamnose 4-epimerase
MAREDRFFVTGGAGFIGTALVDRLASEFQSWTIYDNLLPQVHGSNPVVPLGDGIEFVNGDVRDFDRLDSAIQKSSPTVVIHLAAETGTAQSADEPELHTDVNVTGTAKLIHAMNDLPVKPRLVVLTSSRAVYGEGPWVDSVGTVKHPLGRSVTELQNSEWDYPGLTALPVSAESTLPAPCNVYGATKLAQEHLLSSWCAAQGVVLVILRLQNVYGPGQSPINPYTGVTNFFFNQSRAGKSIPVYEDGAIYRDFVLIDDVVQAITTSLKSNQSAVADVGSGAKHSIHELASIISKIVDGPEPIVTGQFRIGDVRHAACDMTKSEWVRDGNNPINLEAGLMRLNEWLLTQSSFKSN